MISILAAGDNVVDCYPDLGRMFPGGNCLNVSIFSRRFGASSSYLGAIGRDPAGQAIEAALSAETVRTNRLRILDGPTAYCIIGRREGDRVFLSFDLGVSMFQPDDEDFAFATSFDAVHIGQSSGLDDHLSRFAAGARLSYDFSTRRALEHRARIAPLCFLAALSAGDLEREAALDLLGQTLAAGARWCLVTRGEQGAMLGRSGELHETPARPTEIVDTLGAGDTFIARTLVGLLRGEEPHHILADAARAAAETCGRVGAVGHGAPLVVNAGGIPSLKPAG